MVRTSYLVMDGDKIVRRCESLRDGIDFIDSRMHGTLYGNLYSRGIADQSGVRRVDAPAGMPAPHKQRQLVKTPR